MTPNSGGYQAGDGNWYPSDEPSPFGPPPQPSGVEGWTAPPLAESTQPIGPPTGQPLAAGPGAGYVPPSARRSAWPVIVAAVAGLAAGVVIGATVGRTFWTIPRISVGTAPPSPNPTGRVAGPGQSGAASGGVPTTSALTDKEWTSLGLRANCGLGGNWGGTARVRNDSGEARTATVTYTLFQQGRVVGTLLGITGEAAPGRTATVTLVSAQKCRSGPFTYDFRVNVSF